jgi:membrane-bound lytic murein transglycosylase D
VLASVRRAGWWRGGRSTAPFPVARATLALAVVLAYAGRARAATGGEFPVPSSLAPAVRFWVDVFTRWDAGQVVLHDRLRPGLVYQVIDAPPGGAGAARIERWRHSIGDRVILSALAAASPVRQPLITVPAVADPTGMRRIRTQRGRREAFAQALAAYRLYAPVVKRALAAEGLPTELAALPLIESSYHPGATSPAGAAGLWQLMPDTARPYLRVSGGVDERHDPTRASVVAARHLHELLAAFGSWPLALTAYNRGQAGVEEASAAVGSTDLGTIVRHYRGPGFGFSARNFYAQFLAALHVLRHADQYFPRPARVVEYRVRRGDTLGAVARRHGVSTAALRVTNGLRSNLLHPGQRLLIRL